MKHRRLSVVTICLVTARCSAFSSSLNRDAKSRVGGRDPSASSRAAAESKSAPVRKSGSLFGLSDSAIAIPRRERPEPPAEALGSPSETDREGETPLRLEGSDGSSSFGADGAVAEEEVDEIADALLLPAPRRGGGGAGEALAARAAAVAEVSVGDDVASWVEDSSGDSDAAPNDGISGSGPPSPARSIERASPSPTHSIEEDYRKMNRGAEKAAVAAGKQVLDSAAGATLNTSPRESSNDGADLRPKGLGAPESVDEHSEPGERAGAESEALGETTSGAPAASTEASADAKPKPGIAGERPEAGSEASARTAADGDPLAARAEGEAAEGAARSSPPPGALPSAAASFLSPAPPPLPPADADIVSSDSATSNNLVEINSQLRETLDDQRTDLGRLRRRVDDLERQLIRANRSKDSKIEEEVNARVESVREECQRQVLVANETVALLQKEAERLFVELDDLTEGMAKMEDDKERVAAEYGYVAKSYVDLKRELEGGKQQISRLEEQLADTTSKLERYQKETRQWKDECANKANALESSNTRIVQLQSTIDGLQTVIQTKESKIKSMSAEEARERRRVISAAKQETRDEFEESLDKKSKKIGELRAALRAANGKKRHIERVSQRETSEALGKLRKELEGEMDELKALLGQKELEVVEMKKIAEEAEGAIEDRERLLAEVMFMAKSVEELQANFTKSSQKYEDLVQSYGEETTTLRQAIIDKDDEIEGLVQVSSANIAKVDLMESQLDDLKAELRKEQDLNADASTELSKLAAKLVQAEANANEYNKQLNLLRNETETLQDHIREVENQKKSFEQTLADERERSDIALEEKVTCIAMLDQELAEKLNELFSLNRTLSYIKVQLEEMTSKYTIEKERADNLEADIRQLKGNATPTVDDSVALVEATSLVELYKGKTNALAQRNLLSEQIISKKLGEIANLRNELDEAASLVKSLPADYEGRDKVIADLKSEISDLTLASRQNQAQANEKILFQSQTVTEQQVTIASLSEQIKNLEESSSHAIAHAEQTKAENESTIAHLEATLENTKNEFNDKISVTDNALKVKEDRIVQLQNDIDKMIKSQEEASKTSSKTKEESSKAKEKLLLKNQLIKEKEDVISQLNTQLNDLQFEKEQIEQTLQDEIKRNKQFYHSHELQLEEMREKLKEQHATDVAEMNETVLQRESEILSLKKKLAESEVPSHQQSSAIDKQNAELSRVEELQTALQQSKTKEVELINRNMMLKNKIEFLEARSKTLAMSSSEDAETKQDSSSTEVGLPSYYKESKRSRVRRVLGGIWGRITRRNKK